MLLGLFESLRAEKVPVTLREWLDLMGALDADLAFADLDAFYHLARTVLSANTRAASRAPTSISPRRFRRTGCGRRSSAC